MDKYVSIDGEKREMEKALNYLQENTDSVIRRMTRVSDQFEAINLSQGFPNFAPPSEITKRLEEIAIEGPHQYPITWGAKNFRDALAKKQTHFMGRGIDSEREIVVTCGSTEAMMASMMTVVNPGEKVIIFSPFYENYGADTILSGAEPIYVPLTPPEFNFDPEVLEDAFRQGAYYILLDVSEFGVKDDLHFCEWLAENIGVGAVPGSSFFRENIHNLVRLHFAKTDDVLNQALDRLSQLPSKGKKGYDD